MHKRLLWGFAVSLLLVVGVAFAADPLNQLGRKGVARADIGTLRSNTVKIGTLDAGTVLFSGPATINGTLTVGGIFTAGTIDAGTLELSGPANIAGAATVTGALRAFGVLTAGTIDAGTLELSGPANIAGAATVVGAGTVGGIFTAGTIDAGTLELSGPANIAGAATVVGAGTVGGIFTAGTIDAGTVHVSGTVYVTGGVAPGASGSTMAWYLVTTHAALDLGSVASGACSAQQTETVTGAALGDSCHVTAATTVEAGAFINCSVTNANEAKWELCNLSGAPVDRAEDTYSIRVNR